MLSVSYYLRAFGQLQITLFFHICYLVGAIPPLCEVDFNHMPILQVSQGCPGRK